VLSYLANGLHVVSIRTHAIAGSDVGDMLVYYDNQTSFDIAAAIKRVDLSIPYDSRAKVHDLNQKFTQEIGELLN